MERMTIEVRKVGSEATLEARRLAELSRCPFRAPHHSVSQAGLVGELALAAGGILFLDSIEEFRGSALLVLKNHLAMMAEGVRPLLFVTHGDEELPESVRKMFGIPLPEAAPGADKARKEVVYGALLRMRDAHEALCRAQQEALDAISAYDKLGDHVHAGGPRPGDCIRCGLDLQLKGPAR